MSDYYSQVLERLAYLFLSSLLSLVVISLLPAFHFDPIHEVAFGIGYLSKHCGKENTYLDMEEPTRNFEVMVYSRETIKPCAPPSDHQRTFKLSFLDQIIPPIYAGVILFYKGTGPPPHSSIEKVDQRSKKLKSSLSETLNRFYPVAGRLKDNLCFSCNDEGVEYLEAQVAPNWSLSDILKKPNPDHLSLLLPVVEEEDSLDICTRPMCLVQVSFFGCGGIAIAIKICHKIADAATLASFVMGWANIAGGANLDQVLPDFGAPDLFPPVDSFPNSTSQVELPIDEKWQDYVRSCRFHFGKSELAALQAKAASTNIPRPTRVEAVIALLWRISLLAKREPKPSALMCAVNLRPRLEPPLSEHSFGNLLSGAVIQCERSTEDIPGMVGEFRRERIDMCSNMVKALDQGVWRPDPNVEELFSKAREGAVELFKVSSWCKFPFYQADFGWEKPVWATAGGLPQVPNTFVLMDTRDSQGIEAWVYLMEEEINILKSNQELLNYASFNPTAVN